MLIFLVFSVLSDRQGRERVLRIYAKALMDDRNMQFKKKDYTVLYPRVNTAFSENSKIVNNISKKWRTIDIFIM